MSAESLKRTAEKADLIVAQMYGDRGQNESGVSGGGGGGVLGGADGMSYFIFFPQHSGHCEAVKRRMSAGRTSIDFRHCSQTILRLRTAVFRATPIVDLSLLNYRTTHQYGTQLTAASMADGVLIPGTSC
jgi:hypothetical protein